MNGELESDDNSSNSSDYRNIHGVSAYISSLPPKTWLYFTTWYPSVLSLTIGFNTVGQRWDNILSMIKNNTRMAY